MRQVFIGSVWPLHEHGGSGAGGGGGAARGEGETQLETDRRLVDKRVDKLKADLEEVKKQRETMRKERGRVDLPHSAIVGYTNSGKSSLLNKLSNSDVLAEDKLFATLDTTTRKLDLPDGTSMLLTDTVGFIRNLPHDLVQSFRATLEESVLADFLIHVIDASSSQALEFYQTTTKVLAELGAGEKRALLVLNKTDLIDDTRQLELRREFPDAIRRVQNEDTAAGVPFRQGGFAVTTAAEDTDRVRRIFIDHVAKPRRTLLHVAPRELELLRRVPFLSELPPYDVERLAQERAA